MKPRSCRFDCEPRFKVMLLLFLAIYFIASSIGSGWALFLCSGILSLCLLSVLLPYLLLKSSKLLLSAPDMLAAGQDIPMTLQFAEGSGLGRSCRFILLKATPQPERLFAQTNPQEILLEDIPRTPVNFSCPGLQRGIQPVPEITLETSFPLGLVWCSISFAPSAIISVLPKTEALCGNFLQNLKSQSYVPGESRRGSQGLPNPSSSRGVRQYRRGDSRRHIHWASSARQGQLMVREFEKDGLPCFDVVLNLSSGWTTPAQFELAISATASILQFGHSQGMHPELRFLRAGTIASPAQLGSEAELSGSSLDILEQLLLLAALDFARERASKQEPDEQKLQGLFNTSKRAVILITAQAAANTLHTENQQGESARTSLHLIRIGVPATPAQQDNGPAVMPQAGTYLRTEDLALL